MKRIHPKGFTLIELLVVVGIIALMISILLPSLAKARELSRRTACGANMKALGTSCLVYSEANRGVFPTALHFETLANGDKAAGVGDRRSFPDGWSTLTAGKPSVNNGSNTRGYFKLLMGGNRAYMQPKQFICPSARTLQHKVQGTDVETTVASGDIVKAWDFNGGQTSGSNSEITDLSYSMQVNLKRKDGDETLGGSLMNTQDPRKAVAADRNPYSNHVPSPTSIKGEYQFQDGKAAFGFPSPPTKSKLYDLQTWDRALRSTYANSRNHAREGQNVVYLDGHAQWQKNSKSGADEDCIWLTQEESGGSVVGDADPLTGTQYQTMRSRSNWLTDSILLP